MWQVWMLPLLVYSVVFALAIPIGLLYGPGVRWPSSHATLACAGSNRGWTPARRTGNSMRWPSWPSTSWRSSSGSLVLTLQPYLPLNPDGKKMLAPTTIFNTVCSFLTNTNLQDYSGEVHLSYFSQLFFICWKQAISPMIGMAALLAIIRGLRGDKHMGNFYVDLWRGTAYFFVPLCLVVGRAAHGQRRAHDARRQGGGDHGRAGGHGEGRQGAGPPAEYLPAGRSRPSWR